MPTSKVTFLLVQLALPLIENDSSFVTAVISVKDNTPRSMYVCIFLHQLTVSWPYNSDSHRLVRRGHILPYLGIAPISCHEYVCEWMESTASRPQRVPNANTPIPQRCILTLLCS